MTSESRAALIQWLTAFVLVPVVVAVVVEVIAQHQRVTYWDQRPASHSR